MEEKIGTCMIQTGIRRRCKMGPFNTPPPHIRHSRHTPSHHDLLEGPLVEVHAAHLREGGRMRGPLHC